MNYGNNMRTIEQTTSFKKDFKQYYKNEIIKERLNDILTKLLNNIQLDSKYKNHPLKGKYVGFYDCHILPDLILIYQLTDTKISLIRIGTHSNLF